MSGETKKKKVVHKFLLCFDGRTSVARELKLVYSTRATSRYQEREDLVLHAPRGRGFSYSGSFALRVMWWCLGPREMFGCNLNQGKLPYFDLRISQTLGLVF